MEEDNGPTGGSGGAGSIYVVPNMQEAVARGFRQHRDTLIDLVAGEAVRGSSKLSRAIKE